MKSKQKNYYTIYTPFPRNRLPVYPGNLHKLPTYPGQEFRNGPKPQASSVSIRSGNTLAYRPTYEIYAKQLPKSRHQTLKPQVQSSRQAGRDSFGIDLPSLTQRRRVRRNVNHDNFGQKAKGLESEIGKQVSEMKSEKRISKLFERISKAQRNLYHLKEPSKKQRAPRLKKLNHGFRSERFPKVRDSPQVAVIGQREYQVESANFASPKEPSTNAPNPQFPPNRDLIGQKRTQLDTSLKHEGSLQKLYKSNIPGLDREKDKNSRLLRRKTSDVQFKKMDLRNAEFPPIFSKRGNQELLSDAEYSNASKRNSMRVETNSGESYRKPEFRVSENPVFKKRANKKKHRNMYRSYNDNFDDALRQKMLNWKSENFNKNGSNRPVQFDFSDIEIKYKVIGGLSQGAGKVCQDNVLIDDFKVHDTMFLILAVFDGHGRLGERLSGFLKSNFSAVLQRELGKAGVGEPSVKKALSSTIFSLHDEIAKLSIDPSANM